MPLFLITLLLFIASCGSGSRKIKRAGEPDIIEVDNNDEEMATAIKHAKSTLSEFEAALKSNNPSFDNFALKVRFENGASGEHIWLGTVSLIGRIYYGVVANVPESTNKVEIGDTIEIDTSRVSDWMFTEGTTLHGGYTIKLLRQRMSKDEQSQFDKENGLTF
ncbi:YegJ family protein [Arcticibacter tournemirensis]|nr:DUF2314 domain-containing protein [Arcticibacter tournemirensis]